MDRTTQTERGPVWAVVDKNPLLYQITVYVKVHLSEKLTLTTVADHFGVSVSTVTQLFHKKARITFHEYVTDCRMEKAQMLILRGRPLETVGKEVGYRDHSTFYRAFRQKYGVSPREYRKTILQKEVN